MRIAGYVFAPRLVPTVAAAAMVALTVSLGRWQVAPGRGEGRRARRSSRPGCARPR